MENTNIVEMTAQEPEKIKPYELQTLNAEHIIPIVSIIRKIGLKELKSCIPEETLEKVISVFMGGAKKVIGTENEEEIKKTKEETFAEIGVSILPTALDILEVILANLEKAEKDIFNFLASVSKNLDYEGVRHLPLPDVAEMIIDILQKKEFKDFYEVVSKFIK